MLGITTSSVISIRPSQWMLQTSARQERVRKRIVSVMIVRKIGHFDNAMDLASMEDLKGMNGDNVKPQKIVSSSSLATLWLCRLQA